MKNKLLATGYKTIILGIVLFIAEYMYLPVFACFQKELVNGQGFYTEIMNYTKMQPYPIIFSLTWVIIFLGASLCVISVIKKSPTDTEKN